MVTALVISHGAEPTCWWPAPHPWCRSPWRPGWTPLGWGRWLFAGHPYRPQWGQWHLQEIKTHTSWNWFCLSRILHRLIFSKWSTEVSFKKRTHFSQLWHRSAGFPLCCLLGGGGNGGGAAHTAMTQTWLKMTCFGFLLILPVNIRALKVEVKCSLVSAWLPTLMYLSLATWDVW